jgi:competence ComEA-like helix-hairpin-helix protein
MSYPWHRTLPASVLAAAVMLGAGIAVAAPHAQGKLPVKVDPALLAKSVGDMTADEEQQFSDAAEATIERVCIACHPFENIIKTRRAAPEWNIQVTTMSQRGAVGTDADFTTIKKYLTRYYGVVRVNTATAEELTAVLGLPAKVAEAVVEYRKAHGNFTDLASLEKVEGVDKAKLEEQPEALRFS